MQGQRSPIADGSAKKVNEKFRRIRPALLKEKTPPKRGQLNA
jgi:hypothetical protein